MSKAVRAAHSPYDLVPLRKKSGNKMLAYKTVGSRY
jgi:hypothetical protein